MKYLHKAVTTVVGAGAEILRIKNGYSGNRSISSIAEEQTSDLMADSLEETNLPVISKYEQTQHEERKEWEQFWISSPLLGKNQLREGKEDFSVALTLIENRRPVLGIIYAPQKKDPVYLQGT